MMLAIDIGNTQSLFALYDKDERLGQWRLATDPRRSTDEFTIWLEQFLSRVNRKANECSHVVIACVVPQSLFAITQAIKQLCGVTPLQIDSELMQSIGMSIQMERPDEVGADRLINALGAIQKVGKGPAIVVDFGTATTFDVISKDGAYQGGVIAPGINLSLEALHRAAAKLPNIGISKPTKVMGRTTIEAMQAGIYFGYLGLIERILLEIQAEIEQKATVIATGGLASLFAPATESIDMHEPDLTMEGLCLAAKKYWKL